MALFWAHFGCNLWFDRARSQAQVNGNKSDSLRKGRLAADRDQQGSAGIRAAEQPSCEKNSPWSQARCGVISWKCAIYIYIIHTLVTCILFAHIGRWLQTHSTLPGSESNLVWCLSHVLHFPWKDMEWIRVIWGLPSGKRFRSYGKSSFLMHQRTKWPCSMANC